MLMNVLRRVSAALRWVTGVALLLALPAAITNALAAERMPVVASFSILPIWSTTSAANTLR